MCTGTPISRSASTDSRPRRARREVTGSGVTATDRMWSMTNWGITRPPGSRPPRPSTKRKRSMRAELSARRAWPSGGAVWGARIRDRPAAATICLPLTDPSLQPREASTQAMTEVMRRAKPDSEEDEQREPDHQAEKHPGRGDDGGGEGLSGRCVAEQEDGLLEALVDQSSGHTAEDVADRCAEQQADHRSMGTGIDIATDLEPGHRAGEDEEQTEPFDEDHARCPPTRRCGWVTSSGDHSGFASNMRPPM